MEYAQERIATLHAYDDPDPPAPVDRATVVVPLAARDHDTPAATHTFDTLTNLDTERVIVALRADPGQVIPVASWLARFDLPLTILWCTAPGVEDLLSEAGLDGSAGKGRDVWLALGLAADSEYVVVHDADATSYESSYVTRLLSPLADGFGFTKAYYARLEDNHLYGRLCRLFVVPLVRALRSENPEAEILQYLDAFRYPLAGEFAVTGDVARELRAPRGWGLEVGTLGDAFAAAGMDATAQVDLGVYEHTHRPVEGDGGLGPMAGEVAQTLFNILEEYGVEPDYHGLPDGYRAVAEQHADQYAADAAFNGLEYDVGAERDQVAQYSDAISRPTEDDRLPAWKALGLDPDTVLARSSAALDEMRSTPQHD